MERGVHPNVCLTVLTLYSGSNLLTDSSCKRPRVADKTAGGKYGCLHLHLIVGVQPMVDTGET